MLFSFRDPMNGLTHFIGAILAVFGLALLVRRATDPIRPWHLTSFTVFGLAMVLLFTVSTVYHWLPRTEQGVRAWKRIDHCMIFVYIAATYTPICLIPLRGPWGWGLLAAVWTVAAAGIIIKIFWLYAPRTLSTALYVAMGWMVLIGIYPLVRSLPGLAVAWLVAGGVLYSIGAAIYALRWPRVCSWLGFHEVFHIFVLLGSLCHFVVMYGYISFL